MEFIKLHSCCISVNGPQRSTICDIQKNTYKLIPNSLFNLIPLFDSLPEKDLINYYGEQHIDVVTEYIDFLIENDFAFRCTKDESELFPPMSLNDFDIPYNISNCILEIINVDSYYIAHVIKELTNVHCLAVEIRIQEKIEIHELISLLTLFETTTNSINQLNILLIYNDYDLYDIKNLFSICHRLTLIILGNAPVNDYHTAFYHGNSHIVYTTKIVHLPTCCGKFSFDSMVINIPFFSESQNYNTCLNRKVAIDKNGNIKNCPSMQQVYGSIHNDKLLETINTSDFQSKWKIDKSKIEVCKDCEFRHICMDCRAYLEDPKNIYSKPLKCGYDPYTTQWQDWSTSPLKQDAKVFYGLIEIY